MDKLLKAYSKIAITGKVPYQVATKFSEENEGVTLTKEYAEDMLRARFKELAPNRKALRRNKVEIFELIEESLDELFPVRANEIFDRFVEFKTFKNGDKPFFKMPKGKGQIRRFIKRVALGVPMVRVRMDSLVQNMEMFVLGGAVYIEWEHYLDGSVDYVDLCNAILDELVNAVYDEISKAISTAVTNSKFKKTITETTDAFSISGLVECISYAKSFGTGGAVVLGTPTMCSRITDLDSDEDKRDVRERGYIGRVRGADVVCLEQSYDKDGNPLFPENVLFVFPSGSKAEDKFIKVGYEGETEIKEKENDDRSLTYEVYAKLGVMLGQTEGIGVYKKYQA